MAVVAISDSILTDIADAIRSKNGQETLYKPSQMPDAIEAISGGGITPTGTKEISITENGTTTEDVTNYASAEIVVNVSSNNWLRIIDDTPSNSYKNGTVTLSNNVFTMNGDGTWKPYIFTCFLFFRFSDLVGKRIKVSLDYVITGITTGKLVAAPALFETPNNISSTSRKNYVASSDPVSEVNTVTENGSGTLTFEFILSSEMMTNTVNTSQYVGLSIYFNANSGASASISNISMMVAV